jgi:hypothetical protein
MEHVNISDKKPTCNRLQSIKLIEILVVIGFETSKRNTNFDNISNEIHVY